MSVSSFIQYVLSMCSLVKKKKKKKKNSDVETPAISGRMPYARCKLANPTSQLATNVVAGPIGTMPRDAFPPLRRVPIHMVAEWPECVHSCWQVW